MVRERISERGGFGRDGIWFSRPKDRKPIRSIGRPSLRSSATEPKCLQASSGKAFPFSKLPKELRLMIWEMVADEQRVVIIKCRGYHPRLSYFSRSPTPTILRVCSESREVALAIYKHSFSSHDQPAKMHDPDGTWFSFKRDCIYFRAWHGLSYPDHLEFRNSIAADQLARIQSIAIDADSFLCRGCTKHLTSPFWGFHEFKGLKTVYVCQPSPRLSFNTKRKLEFSPPMRDDEKAILERHQRYFDPEAYRVNFREKGINEPGALTHALEKLKGDLLPEDAFEGRMRPEVRFAVVHYC